MGEFTPITTQEQFDAAIKDRLARERSTVTGRYADYGDLKAKVSEYEGQIAQLQQAGEQSATEAGTMKKQIEDLTARNKGYELSALKTKVALETGLPYAAAARLTGEDEKTIRQDAESLMELFGGAKEAPPLKSTEDPAVDSKRAAMQRLTRNLVGKGE